MQSLSRGSLELETRGRTLYGTVRGVVTLSVMRAIRLRLTPVSPEVAAMCLDYSGSLLLLTANDLYAIAEMSAPGASRLAIAWIVPDAETATVWRKQATSFALRGLSRFATENPAAAHQWAQQEAAHAVGRLE